jgi:pimeloyl-ACP methyl ester carboxylesterase
MCCAAAGGLGRGPCSRAIAEVLESAIAELGATRIPMLLLHGGSDQRFPASHALEADDRLPNARAVVIDHAAHMAHIDQPRAWLDAIETFLSED